MGKNLRRSGVLRVLDFDSKERELVEFTDALVTEIGFPALDAASRDAFELTVRLSADTIRRGAGSGASALGSAGTKKRALVSNFSVSLDNLDLKRVSRIGR